MTQEMVDWKDQRETVMRAFNVCIRDSRKRVASLMTMGLSDAADAENAYRHRQIAKRDAWERDHDASKPRA